MTQSTHELVLEFLTTYTRKLIHRITPGLYFTDDAVQKFAARYVSTWGPYFGPLELCGQYFHSMRRISLEQRLTPYGAALIYRRLESFTKKDLADNVERLDAYMETMRRHGLDMVLTLTSNTVVVHVGAMAQKSKIPAMAISDALQEKRRALAEHFSSTLVHECALVCPDRQRLDQVVLKEAIALHRNRGEGAKTSVFSRDASMVSRGGVDVVDTMRSYGELYIKRTVRNETTADTLFDFDKKKSA